jgi:predicted RNA-binding Zn ribbon-like protein
VLEFELIGGVACLDFANTLDGRRGYRTSERLRSYGDLLAWSRQAGVLGSTAARRLARVAARQPTQSAAVLARALELREALYRIFDAYIAGRLPTRADLATLDRELRQGWVSTRLVTTRDGFDWKWEGDAEALDQMLVPIARSAGELLTSSAVDRVRECSSDTCGWLFLDGSKNRARRWCDMRTCGNLQKVRRHRDKHRRTRGPRRSTQGRGVPDPQGG